MADMSVAQVCTALNMTARQLMWAMRNPAFPVPSNDDVRESFADAVWDSDLIALVAVAKADMASRGWCFPSAVLPSFPWATAVVQDCNGGIPGTSLGTVGKYSPVWPHDLW